MSTRQGKKQKEIDMNENLKKINKLKRLIKKHDKEYQLKKSELEELHEADSIGGDEMDEELEKLRNLHHSKEFELQEKLQVPKPWKPIYLNPFEKDTRLYIRAKYSEYYLKIAQFYKSTDLSEKESIWRFLIEDADNLRNELSEQNQKMMSDILDNMQEHLEELRYIEEGE